VALSEDELRCAIQGIVCSAHARAAPRTPRLAWRTPGPTPSSPGPPACGPSSWHARRSCGWTRIPGRWAG